MTGSYKREEEHFLGFGEEGTGTQGPWTGQSLDYPAHQYQPQNAFDEHSSGQLLQPDMFMYETGFNASLFESVALVGDVDLHPYMNDLNWSQN